MTELIKVLSRVGRKRIGLLVPHIITLILAVISSHSVLFLLCAIFCLGAASRDALAQDKKQSADQGSKSSLPTLCGGGSLHQVSLVVDLNATSASRQLEFCPPNGTKSVQARLTAGDFTSKMTKLGLGTSVIFSDTEGKSSGSTFALPAIQPGESATVKVQVNNLWEAGEAEAPLTVNGIQVGKLVAIKYRLPFGVRVEAPDPAKPEITLQRAEDYDVVLKNDDPVTYQIEWDFHLAGTSFHDSSVVTPNSSVKFTIRPDGKWYGWLTGLPKDYDQDGKLTLSFRPPGVEGAAYWPSKVIPVKVHLRNYSESTRAWFVNIVLIFFLFAGAMFSFLGSVALPNRLKRSDYRESLARLAQRIGGISHQVDSRLRVVIRVQCKRLSELLGLRMSISADLNRVFNEVSQGRAALERQVHLAEQIDAAHNRLKMLDVKGAAPSLLNYADETVRKAAEVISHVAPTDEELDQSQKLLAEADTLMDKTEGFDDKFAKELLTRAIALQKQLKPYTETNVYKKIHEALPGVFADLTVSTAPTRIEESSRLDRDLFKLEVIRQFLQIYHVTENHQLRTRFDDQLKRLLVVLGLESFEAIRTAWLLVREMQEGVYPSDLVEAGRAGAVQIETDPNLPVANDLIRFSVRFGDQRFNTAAARLEFEGRWNFGHEYSEIGWEPSHYFPHADSFHVTFSFQAPGDKEPVVVKRTIKMVKTEDPWYYTSDRNRAEILRFFITLMPALFGLLAGARDQLLKMDTASALFAVFLLGFSSDTVKNLVSQSQQTQPASPTTPTTGSVPGAPGGAKP